MDQKKKKKKVRKTYWKNKIGWHDLRENHWNLHITMCKIAKGSLMYDKAPRPTALWRPGGIGWVGKWVQEGGNICMTIAYSCWCTAETITILLKKKKKHRNFTTADTEPWSILLISIMWHQQFNILWKTELLFSI